jgi:multidrug transporter EmrE-like cation transporter
MALLLLAAASIFYSAGGYFMKLSDGLTRRGASAAVFVLFCAGAALQAIGMRHSPMGVSYVVVLGLEAVAALSIGLVVLGERLSVSAVAGVLLVVAGIVLLRFSQG